jgi:bla regulator protein blaR1
MMPKYFSATEATMVPALANHLWQSTLFALVAAILTLALRRNQARIRYHLWLAASLKFLLPFSLLISLGGHLARPPLWVNAQGGLYTAVKEIGQPFTFVVTPVGHAVTAASLLPLLPVALWLCGFVTVLSLWSLHWRRVVATMDAASPLCQGREVDALRRLEQLGGVRRPIGFLLSRNSLEPGIFGIVRPVLLWPAPLSEHLTDTHLEAILAHELCHVRRRDNLAASIHMAVEAIFWFHPLVWWLGARLVEERERACDEEVLRLGNPPQIYAESILKTCEFCVSAPLACISGVTGADLKQRIVRIMTGVATNKLSSGRRIVLVCAGMAAVTGPVLFGLMTEPLVSAQSPQTNAAPPPATDGGAQRSQATPIQNPSQGIAGSPKTYHVGGDVSAPKLIFAPDPQFSDEALQAKYQGVCVLSLIVDAEGRPRRLHVVRHLGMGLDQKAVEAVEQYTFKPAMRFGKPVAVEVNIEVNFKRD